MSIEPRGHMCLDYQPVSYPGSVVRFRGPAADFRQPFVLCLGGAETFGRFIDAPYPDLLSQAAAQATAQEGRRPCGIVNLGVPSAGLDVMLTDPVIRAASAEATEIVMQITGAANMNNRFYSVHPRRNDRFLKASSMLRTIYPEVDFTEFHFSKHMLTHLRRLSRDRFALVEQELRTAWLARMSRFLARVGKPVHLLWLALRSPDSAPGQDGIGPDPLFIGQNDLDAVAANAASLSVVVPPDGARASGNRGMIYAAREEKAAAVLPGPMMHRQAADGLLRQIGCLHSAPDEKAPRLI